MEFHKWYSKYYSNIIWYLYHMSGNIFNAF